MPTLERFENTILTLQAAGLTVYPEGSVYTDGDGNLVAPNQAAFVTVTLINTLPVPRWGKTPEEATRFQITSLASTPSASYEQLNTARAALAQPRYQPDIVTSIGRLTAGGRAWHVTTQDFIQNLTSEEAS